MLPADMPHMRFPPAGLKLEENRVPYPQSLQAHHLYRYHYLLTILLLLPYITSYTAERTANPNLPPLKTISLS
jgi:hypothetical protein